MRAFTKDEQELLRRIADGRGRNLYNLIDPWIQGVSFQVDYRHNTLVFVFEQSPRLNLLNRLAEIQTIVIQSANLIKLFEDKGYIFTFVNASQLPPNPFTFGLAAVNIPSIPYQFPDSRTSKMFVEYSTREIFVTPELHKFIKDKFITREEWRANRQWRTTRAALLVATSALIFNILFNLWNTFLRPSDKNVELETNLNTKIPTEDSNASVLTDTNHSELDTTQNE